MKLSNEAYDLLKFISIYVIPSIETFWLTVGTVWKLPYVEPIGITIGALGLLIAGCIGMSVAEYNKVKAEEHEGNGDAD